MRCLKLIDQGQQVIRYRICAYMVEHAPEAFGQANEVGVGGHVYVRTPPNNQGGRTIGPARMNLA
jgi:hypothetical protein